MPLSPLCERLRLCGGFEGKARGSESRVAPAIHRRRSRVIRRAFKDDLDARNPDDRSDEAEIDAIAFKNDALLDVQLQIARESRRFASPRRAGSPPTRAMAAASVSPAAFLAASVASSSTPAMVRLPTQEIPYSLGSSARKSTTSIGCRSRSPLSRKARTISSAAMTPAGPSNLPPEGTVSECDPTNIACWFGLDPSSRPIRLAPASRRTLSPASSKRL